LPSDDTPLNRELRAHARIQFVLQGHDIDIEPLGEHDALHAEAMAIEAAMRSDFEESRKQIHRAWLTSNAANKRRKPRLQTDMAPLLTVIAATGSADDRQLALQQISGPAARSESKNTYKTILWWMNDRPTYEFNPNYTSWIELLVASLAFIWSNVDDGFSHLSSELMDDLSEELHTLSNTGLLWPSRQLEACLEMLTDERTDIEGALVGLHAARTEWESQIDALESLLGLAKTNSGAKTADERVAWIVSLLPVRSPRSLRDILSGSSAHSDKYVSSLSIEPRLQKRKKNGWTAGRVIAISRLYLQPETISALTDDDRRIIATIQKYQSYYESFYEYSADLPLALVGHPRVFWSNIDETPIEVCRETPSLQVDKDKKGGLRLTISPTPPDASIWCERAEGRLIVYTLTEDQRRLTERIGDGLQLPAQAETRLKGLLTRAAGLLPVRSDVAAQGGDAVEHEADPRIVAELSRLGEGISVRLSTYPLGSEGPHARPGRGNIELVAQFGGELRRCRRDLSQELANERMLRQACPTIDAALDTHGQADLPDVVDALDTLEDLRQLGDEVHLLWKKGTPLEVKPSCEDSALQIAVKSAQADWFTAKGSLQVDEDLV
ncbi:MAG: hypothetical protein AAF449_21840, partial [Myxococcota bacterium]